MTLENLIKASKRTQVKYYLNGECLCGKPKNPTLYGLYGSVVHIYCENCFAEVKGYDLTPLTPKELFTLKIFLDNS